MSQKSQNKNSTWVKSEGSRLLIIISSQILLIIISNYSSGKKVYYIQNQSPDEYEIKKFVKVFKKN